MKRFIISLSILAVAGIFLGLFLWTQWSARLHVPGISSGNQTPQNNLSSGSVASTTSAHGFVPAGFHGPTGAPHVNGPTKNPPNY